MRVPSHSSADQDPSFWDDIPIEQRFFEHRLNGATALEGLTLCILGPITTCSILTKLNDSYNNLTHTFEHPCRKTGWRLVGLTFNDEHVAKHVLTHSKTLFPDAPITRWWVGKPRMPDIIEMRRKSSEARISPETVYASPSATSPTNDKKPPVTHEHIPAVPCPEATTTNPAKLTNHAHLPDTQQCAPTSPCPSSHTVKHAQNVKPPAQQQVSPAPKAKSKPIFTVNGKQLCISSGKAVLLFPS